MESTSDLLRQAMEGAALSVEVLAVVVIMVAIDTTLVNVAILGALAVVRTFLSWSPVVEMDGRWPWQVGGANPLREERE